jgi:SAM-dependent methyltransferase
MKKAAFSSLLRKLGVIYYADLARFYFQKIQNLRQNQNFLKKHPDFALPSDYLMYESYGLDYHKYYDDGKETAEWLLSHFKKHAALENARILDWGCGPARTIRHFPNLLGGGCECYGADYNEKTVVWCKKHIEGVAFSLNIIDPPLPFEDDFFDIIYGLSVLTHLSEPAHHRWMKELLRVSKPGGILFLTTHGEAFRDNLSKNELVRFDNGELVIRDKVKEGHRMFGAFHPKAFMREFFEDYAEIAEFVPGKTDYHTGKPEQDIWILRK